MYRILEPIKVGSLTLKNRIAYLGMGKTLSTPDNFVTDRQIAYYENFARNDVALISTGGCIVFPEYPSRLPLQPGLYDDKFIPGLTRLADAVHKHGAKLLIQPWHGGKKAYLCNPDDCKLPADFTIEEIHDMQDRFVEAIERIYKSGADGCEWHMGHNYLMEEFAVELFNKRTDEYGADTIENAARFSTEIVRRAKERCGKDFLIGVKINAYDMGFEGGMTPDRCAAICQLLEEAGAELFTISAGGGLTDETGTSEDGYGTEGWKIEFADIVKKAVKSPVIATGTLRHLDVMEKALEEGKCDMIGMGRGLLAEPEFVKKVEEGRVDELRCCINCMNCFNPNMGTGHCSMNPRATYEIDEPMLKEDGDGKTAMVIGAGPAGIEASVALAKRGFETVLVDNAAQIGGSMFQAAAPVGKSKLNWGLDSYKRDLAHNNVKVLLNTQADADLINKLDPYAVFVATGTNPVMPRSIPGITLPHVLEARKFLTCPEPIHGENVAVIGGGLVGLETASEFAVHDNNTTIVEMMPADKMKISKPYLLAKEHAAKHGVSMNYGCKLVEIMEKSIIIEDADGNRSELPADRVIICMGYKPNKALYEELSAQRENVVWIGSDEGIDNIPTCARRGYVAAARLEA